MQKKAAAPAPAPAPLKEPDSQASLSKVASEVVKFKTKKVPVHIQSKPMSENSGADYIILGGGLLLVVLLGGFFMYYSNRANETRLEEVRQELSEAQQAIVENKQKPEAQEVIVNKLGKLQETIDTLSHKIDLPKEAIEYDRDAATVLVKPDPPVVMKKVQFDDDDAELPVPKPPSELAAGIRSISFNDLS